MSKGNNDSTRQILQGILTDLYTKQTGEVSTFRGSYLLAQDKQYLGMITDNRYDQNSLLNRYGPYGSRYSLTSVFNRYSQYASRYATMSLNNPYSTTPPRLFVGGTFFAYVTENRFLKPRITPEIFFYNLENNIQGLMKGKIEKNESQSRQRKRESFIEAADGIFLGSLLPNQFDQDSIFNKFGNYGSQFSPGSIFNNFGTYGNPYSQFSPYNSFSNQPPKIYANGEFIAYLTKNQFMTPRIDPDGIYEWAQSNISHTN